MLDNERPEIPEQFNDEIPFFSPQYYDRQAIAGLRSEGSGRLKRSATDRERFYLANGIITAFPPTFITPPGSGAAPAVSPLGDRTPQPGSVVSDNFFDGGLVTPPAVREPDTFYGVSAPTPASVFGPIEIGLLIQRRLQIDFDRRQIQTATNEFLLKGGDPARSLLGGFADTERNEAYLRELQKELARRKEIGVIGPSGEDIGFGNSRDAGLPGFIAGIVTGGVNNQNNIPASEETPPAAVTTDRIISVGRIITGGFVTVPPPGAVPPKNPFPLQPVADPNEPPPKMVPPGAFPDDLFRRNPPDP